jgi:hypothetical protein
VATLTIVPAPPREAEPFTDGEAAEALRWAANLLGPTTRGTLLRHAATGLVTPDPTRLDVLLRRMKSLGDLAGDPKESAVAPAPLRALRLSEDDEQVQRFLLVGGPRTAALRLPLHVSNPFLRVARLGAAEVEALVARVEALGGLVLPWQAWAGERPAHLDAGFVDGRRRPLEEEATDQFPSALEDLRLCRPGAGPADHPTRWTRPRRAESGWFLARLGRHFGWFLVEGGQPRRWSRLPWSEAAALQFALEHLAGASRSMQLQLLGDERACLVVPSPLPREEWRLLRALAWEVQGRAWTLDVRDARWLSRVLQERLGVAVEEGAV